MPPQTVSEQAAAWSFVLQHKERITKLVNRFCHPNIENEELDAQVVADLGERAHQYDPNKGQPSTFIVWRIRAVQTRMVRKNSRELATDPADFVDQTALSGVDDGAKQIEQSILVKQTLEIATPNQREACESLMVGLSGIEIREQLGCGITARNARLYRLSGQIRRTQAR
mgnify:CR=1 FL=1